MMHDSFGPEFDYSKIFDLALISGADGSIVMGTYIRSIDMVNKIIEEKRRLKEAEPDMELVK